MIRRSSFLLLAGLLAGFAGAALSQPEMMPSGSVTGIRVEGQLFAVNSRMCVVRPDWSGTLRGGGRGNYTREGKIVTVKMQPAAPGGRGPAVPTQPAGQPPAPSFYAVKSVEDTGPGTAKIDVEYTFPAATDMAGAYLCLQLPASDYSGGRMQLIDPVAPAPAAVPPAAGTPVAAAQPGRGPVDVSGEISLAPRNNDQNEYVRATASGVRFTTPRRQLEVRFSEPAEVVVRDDRRQNDFGIQVYLAVLSGKAAENQTVKKSFNLKVTGEIDKTPAQIVVEAGRPGRLHAGFGGNFRLQFPKTDPAIIQYNLDNMRLAYGRVAMPWNTWHPIEEADPLAEARAGKVAPGVDAAMRMAQRLARMGTRVIVSDWAPPAWAIVGAGNRAAGGGRGGGGGGGFLDPAKMDRIKESLAGYLVFLKEKYGVEAVAFSFNESDIGINVRQTAREHADLIKTLGPYFASRGLATKLLVGDTGNATPVHFIDDAMNDAEARQWIYAVSFHSWRGTTPENLAIWGANARALNVPLLVGEGGADSNAHTYPQLFREPFFALQEVETYERIRSIAQAESILHWQLTADYSLLAGGGQYNDNGPLRPTQRFWNMKQLASTPPNVFYLPAKCDRPGLTCTAFGDIASGVYAVNVVNTGAARPTTLTGLPVEVKQLRVWVTDAQRGMQEGARIPVTDGKAQFTLDPASYTTLVSAQ
jgi:hypothetical protein